MVHVSPELEQRLNRLAQERGVDVDNLVEDLLTPVLSREELRDKPLGIEELLAPHRAAVLAIAERYHARDVKVFGSVARGEATLDSDIDLLIDFAPGATLWDRIGLKQDLEELLAHPVDVSTPQTLRDEIKDRVLAEAVPL